MMKDTFYDVCPMKYIEMVEDYRLCDPDFVEM